MKTHYPFYNYLTNWHMIMNARSIHYSFLHTAHTVHTMTEWLACRRWQAFLWCHSSLPFFAEIVMFLYLLSFQSLIKKNTDSSREYLSNLYPRLKLWYNWFNKTQAGPLPYTYRWLIVWWLGWPEILNCGPMKNQLWQPDQKVFTLIAVSWLQRHES